MVKTFISSLKDIKKYTDERIKVPFIYIIFAFTLFLFTNRDFIGLIDFSNWLRPSMKNFILYFLNLIYSKYLLIVGLLVTSIFMIVGFLYIGKNKNFGAFKDYRWNEYVGISRIINIIRQLSTSLWILYFSFNVLLNENDYVVNFIYRDNNILVSRGYISETNLITMNILFLINIIILVFYIIRSIFKIYKENSRLILKEDDIYDYNIINSSSYKNPQGHEYRLMILKEKYIKNPKFLIVRCSPNRTHSNPYKVDRFIYEVVDESESLRDIIYHFENYSKGDKYRY